MRREVLRMERVCCLEQDVIQLEDFNLSIFSGEIMGLLPLNNHGLTALLKLLQYNTPLRYGYVYYREEQVNTWRTANHRYNRIGLIQSESCLVEDLTVVDNIFVLRQGFKSWLVEPHILREQLLPFLESIDIFISADSYVGDLSPFERIVVAVLKSVVAGYRLIVLRDISASLSETELRKIHRLLNHYSEQGFSFLYVDFHFEELCQVCHKVALMSNGRIIKILKTDADTPETFEHYTKVYNGKVRPQIAKIGTADKTCEPVFEMAHMRGQCIRDLSFHVAAGECVVLQDLDHQIFGELLAVLYGETKPKSGTIRLAGKPVLPRPGAEIAVIQELPTKTMLFEELSYLDNLCFTLDCRLPEVWRSRSVREGIRREYTPLLGNKVFDRRVDMLNEMQKYELIYHRVAIQRPKVTFCIQPFRRADMELRMHIWEQLKMLLDQGIAVVILAVTLADSLSLADRLIRIRKGKIEKIYERSNFHTMSISAPWLTLYQDVYPPTEDVPK
ncbi:ATP-binding cassette domain-containing protein [Oscillospiraceae bacterium LTW-04]|nr:sugar ABC transporter ATP-binding protein [Oscillospiraceae bacterium MB24-C1]